eukprot:gene4209-4458_t
MSACGAPSRRALSSNAANSSTINTRASLIRTEVITINCENDVVAEKIRQLQQIGPSGRQRLWLYRAISLPVWMMYIARLIASYAARPAALLKRPDPLVFQLKPPFPLHEEMIVVNGIKLHAVSPRRNPGKPLMLMLHGWPECWYSWRHQMAALADDWDVVALDLRGFNTSDKPQGVDNYKLSVLASDVREAVLALGHSSCTLMAHDWGGLVAWTAAGLYGSSLVKQLVVMALPHFGIALTNYNTEEYLKLTYQLFFQARGLAELFVSADDAAVMNEIFRGPKSGVKNKAALSEADVAWFRSAMCQPGAASGGSAFGELDMRGLPRDLHFVVIADDLQEGGLNYYRALMEFATISDPDDPVWSALRRQLDQPVLVLHGADDVALGRRLLTGIEAAVPKATVKVLENCSHWVQQDYPQQVNDIVIEWLRQQQQTETNSSHPHAE